MKRFVCLKRLLWIVSGSFFFFSCHLKNFIIIILILFIIIALLRYSSHTMKFILLKCTIWYFWHVYKIVRWSPLSNSRTSTSSPKETLYPIVATPNSPLPPCLLPCSHIPFTDKHHYSSESIPNPATSLPLPTTLAWLTSAASLWVSPPHSHLPRVWSSPAARGPIRPIGLPLGHR